MNQSMQPRIGLLRKYAYSQLIVSTVFTVYFICRSNNIVSSAAVQVGVHV